VFYFQQLLNMAMTGIDGTAIVPTVTNFAFAILLVGFLIGLYQAAFRGGDVQALAVTAVKYLVVAMIVSNWSTVFRDVNGSFNAVANFIGNSSGAGDMFQSWMGQLQQQFVNNPSLTLWDIITGDPAGIITVLLLLVAYVVYALAIIVFCFFYVLFGSLLYVLGPLVLALIPISGIGQLGKSYAINLMIWNAWGILYAVFGALITAIQFNRVDDVLGNGFLGYLKGLPDSTLLGLVSIFYALAVALIPFIAKRIISGDAGSAVYSVVRAGMFAVGAAVAAGVGMSAGAAAVNYAIQNITEVGTNIVSVPQLYGATFTLFAHLLPKQGVEVRFAEDEHPSAIGRLIDQNTRAVYCESIGNPAGNIVDIEALARVAHEHSVPLIVDNTVATPILLRPIEYGADVVVHSLTKFMGGHGTTLGGAIVDSGRFPWKEHDRRFPMFSEPDPSYHDMVYTDHYKEAAYIGRCRSVYQRTTGSVLSPLSAFLLLQGIETIALRVERHVENGRSVAEFLRKDRRVEWVNYAGLPESPYHGLAQKYLGGRGCSLMTFGVKGGLEAGKKFYDALKLIKRLVNIGDAKSLACHPASTTHRQMSTEEQRKAGVGPETMRLSIGIEHIDDIIGDLDQALDATVHRRSGPAINGLVAYSIKL